MANRHLLTNSSRRRHHCSLYGNRNYQFKYFILFFFFNYLKIFDWCQTHAKVSDTQTVFIDRFYMCKNLTISIIWKGKKVRIISRIPVWPYAVENRKLFEYISTDSIAEFSFVKEFRVSQQVGGCALCTVYGWKLNESLI